jgi:rare lipoprotein A
MLKVTNLANGNEVLVKVTDRGPFGRGRIIDLSYSAARDLGMLAQGVALVEVEPVTDFRPPYRSNTVERGYADFDFDITQAGYSIIGDWKNDDMAPPIADNTPSKEPTSGKLTAPTPNTAAPRKGSNTPSATKLTTTSGMKASMPPNAPANNPDSKQKTEDPKKWSNVFEKIKNWIGR